MSSFNCGNDVFHETSLTNYLYPLFLNRLPLSNLTNRGASAFFWLETAETFRGKTTECVIPDFSRSCFANCFANRIRVRFWHEHDNFYILRMTHISKYPCNRYSFETFSSSSRLKYSANILFQSASWWW